MTPVHPMIALLLLGFFLSACATGGAPPQTTAFDPALQKELLRARQEQQVREPVLAEPPPLTVEDWLRDGDSLRDGGEYARAMWSYLQAHELDLQDPEPLARMGSLHLTVEPKRAEAIARALIDAHPRNAAAYTVLGLARIARHSWDEAREALAQAVEIAPESAPALSALGVTLDRLERHTEAREAYGRAVASAPDYYEALNNLGVSYLSTEEFALAAEMFQRASRLETRDPAVFNNLGLALGRLERYDEALAAFRRAGSEQAARNNLGFVHFLNMDYTGAIEEYERALLAGGDEKLRVLGNLRAAQRSTPKKPLADAPLEQLPADDLANR